MTPELTIGRQRGQLIIQVLLFSSFAFIILAGLVIWADFAIKTAYGNTDRRTALMIAEAGVEYYRWHLAHNKTDFQDGTGQPGPYTHNYYDKNGVQIGQFILEVTPPVIGSTVVTIRSTGKLTGNPNIERIIEVKLAISSFSKFAAVSNANLWFGPGTIVFGPIHSNGGIRFDGLAHHLVTSARTDYNDPDHSGNEEFGVHTHVAPIDPQPPAAVPQRQDVFLAGRQFPVPAVDFGSISGDLADMKTTAQSESRYFADSGGGNEGYHIVLKENDTFDLYRVTDTVNPPNGCVEVLGQQDWGTWTIEDETFIQNYSFPASGIIFVEDDVWIDGKINTARITIASGRFPDNPSTNSHIAVNKDLLYTNYDGQDVIGLLAQGNFNVGWNSEDDIRIDAALIAQNGRVGRHYYRPPSGSQDRCAPYHIRQKLTSYGMIASDERYGFAYSDGTGYQIRELIYDPNLLYGPPPSFPLTADSYSQVQWKELK